MRLVPRDTAEPAAVTPRARSCNAVIKPRCYEHARIHSPDPTQAGTPSIGLALTAVDRRPAAERQDLRDPTTRPPSPSPVVAKALGYHDKTATRLVTEAGGTWARYAPGDHLR